MKKNILFLLALIGLPAFAFAKISNPAPHLFTENKGQVHDPDHSGLSIYYVFQSGELSYYFSDRGYSVVQHAEGKPLNRVDFFFSDGSSHIPRGVNGYAGRMNFYLGGNAFTAAAFSEICYSGILGNCSVEFSFSGDYLQKKLLAPGGIPKENIFTVSGASQQRIPRCYLPVDEETYSSPAGSFSEIRSLLPDANDATQTGKANARAEHPEETASNGVISWYTYVGGTDADELFAIALMPGEGAVVAGRTASIDFPATAGSLQDTVAGSYDAVILRFDSAGNCLWSTYYGGTNFETAYAVLRIGERIIVAGSENSTDLPMINSVQPNNAGSYDAFLLALDDSGMMVRASYYGGGAADQAFALAEDTLGRIVVAGSSTGAGLPASAGSFQPAPAGAIDAFLAVFDTVFNPLWATYYGGSSSEDIHSVTVTPQGEIAFCGGTYSTNFPVTANAYQPGLIGIPDVYLVKFGMDGTRHYATFFGGGNSEDANSITCDSLGYLYLAGFTYSTIDFPIAGNSFQSIGGALSDAYVACFDPNGQLYWSTFIGGNGVETAYSVYRLGKYIFVGGTTESTDFPVSANAIQSVYAANSDGFVVKLDTAGNMVCGTYMGGNGVDAIYGLVVTPADTSVIACADTYSTDLPVTPGAYQSVNHGSGDAYVVKFGMSEELLMDGVEGIVRDESGTLLIYPNPAGDFIRLNVVGETINRTEIIDAAGRTVLSKNDPAAEETIDLSGLPEGIYTLVIYSGTGNRHSAKLVRQ